MYIESLTIIVFFLTQCISNRLLGEIQYETTEGIPIYSLDWDVWCKFQANTYDCGKKGQHLYRYYFDVTLRVCASAKLGDCDYNKNSFGTLKECQEMCREPGRRELAEELTPNAFCCMQPEFGACDGYYPMWYFDVSTRTCKSFSYSGCGGNQNKFATVQDCTSNCLPNVVYKLW